jgi:hypothetical protein
MIQAKLNRMADNLALICWSATGRFPRWVSAERYVRLRPRSERVIRDVEGLADR